MSSSYRALTVTRSADDYIVTVELHRPEALNAMNTAMGQDLLHCFGAFTWDTAARAVVFAGAGDKAFCVGGDLKEREGMTDEAWRAQHLIFEQAAEKYGDVMLPGGDTVAERVVAALFEIRNLCVGKEAPDIEGVDQDSKRFKLSDYRGKVVLLDFWSYV